MRLIIVDDHQAIRYGVKAILASLPEVDVVAEASSAAELLERLRDSEADAVLLDISLADGNGLDLIRAVKAANSALRVLMFTSSYASVERAMSLGADGYLTKDSDSSELAEALREISAGRPYIGRSVEERMKVAFPPNSAESHSLTPREREIMMSIIRGKRIKEIGVDLGISDKTVATHRARMLKKLDLSDNRALFRYALQHGLADWN